METTEITEEIIEKKIKQESRPRVFVLNSRQNVDITSAIEFGPIIPLFKPYERKEDRPSIWREEFLDEVIARMEQNNFNPEIDYILIAGNVNGIVIWLAGIFREWDEAETIKLLMWNAYEKNYVVMEM